MAGWNFSKVLSSVRQYRDLLFMLTWRDINIKYKQSIMGFMWAILMPMLIVGAGVLVRYAFSRLTGEPVSASDVAAVSVKAVPWAFVVAGIRFSTTSLISNQNLVTKIYFPRELFPVAATISQFFDLLVASSALALFLGLVGVGVSSEIWWTPVLLAVLFVLVLGLGILLSALALFFRDVKYLVEVMLTFGIFFTPVFYDVGLFGDWAPVLLLNPVAPVLEALDKTIVRHAAPDFGWLLYSAAVAAVLMLVSIRVFKNLEPAFAENI